MLLSYIRRVACPIRDFHVSAHPRLDTRKRLTIKKAPPQGNFLFRWFCHGRAGTRLIRGSLITCTYAQTVGEVRLAIIMTEHRLVIQTMFAQKFMTLDRLKRHKIFRAAPDTRKRMLLYAHAIAFRPGCAKHLLRALAAQNRAMRLRDKRQAVRIAALITRNLNADFGVIHNRRVMLSIIFAQTLLLFLFRLMALTAQHAAAGIWHERYFVFPATHGADDRMKNSAADARHVGIVHARLAKNGATLIRFERHRRRLAAMAADNIILLDFTRLTPMAGGMISVVVLTVPRLPAFPSMTGAFVTST